jgi:chromosome partition protein MukF
MTSPARSNEQILSLIAEQKLSLELSTLELGFLVALHLQAQGEMLTSFNEAQLEDVFVQASHVLAPDVDQRRRRATHAIKRLREQRLLARVDGQGVVRTGEYALSRLALGIVEFFLEDEVLTRDSLIVLTSSLRVSLGSVRQAAREAADAAAWQSAVTAPLRVTIAELVAGIERRQRGLDLQQESLRAEIRRLLEADWFAALSSCQSVLESTSATLQELNHVLLRDSSELLAMLQDIEELAHAARELDAAAACSRLMDQVDRITAWGSARQRAFSDYFQYVHRYLRDVVRLDPARALTQRLRDQLAGRGARFALTYAASGPLTLLRSVTSVPDKPPVLRPRAARERELAADSGEDREAVLDHKVREALAGGASALSQLTRAVTEELPVAERFLEAGRVAHSAARHAHAKSAVDRPWVPAGEGLLIEEWSLERAPHKQGEGDD